MVFLHELHHTSIGGSYKDPTEIFGTGPVVDSMNEIRKELNKQGFNYGKRFNYAEILTTQGKIIPFNAAALGGLQEGIRMGGNNKYIIIK